MKRINLCKELFAVIDVGSNTLRLLIGCIVNKELIRIASSRSVTRLGKDLLKNHELNNESIDKSISSLIEFKSIYEQFKVKKVFAIGTSALREAKNSKDFIRKVRDNTGIDIEIISGDKEAELTQKGILSNFNYIQEDLSALNKFFIIDIGGGSTEWIIHGQDNIKGSLPLGAVKAYEEFMTEDPPELSQIIRLKDYIYSELVISGLIKLLHDNYTFQNIKFVATGGTVTTLAAIDMGLLKYNGEKINMHRIPRPTLQAISQRLLKMPLAERQTIEGLEPDRADIIITGTLILQSFMETFGFKELIVSDFGLLEGLLVSIENDK